jgi:glyoxylate reductase
VTPTVAIARVLLPAGAEMLEATGVQTRVGGLDSTPDQVTELAAGATALIADPTVRVDGGLLDAAGEQLRVVANFAVGVDNVDLEACRERGVIVTNTPGVLTNATAEAALALTLAAARRTGELEQELRNGGWTGWDPGGYIGIELTQATFAVIGLGRIGHRYAELVRPLAKRLLYVARSAKPDAERNLDAEQASLEEALAEADVVSLHAPAGPETHHMIGAAELEAMKPGAILVNTARGSLVDADALAAALRDGKIAAAGLDVYEHEPEVPKALLEAPNAVLLPHIGSATRTSRDAMARTVAENVIAVLDGREPPNRVA